MNENVYEINAMSSALLFMSRLCLQQSDCTLGQSKQFTETFLGMTQIESFNIVESQ